MKGCEEFVSATAESVISLEVFRVGFVTHRSLGACGTLDEVFGHVIHGYHWEHNVVPISECAEKQWSLCFFKPAHIRKAH